MQTKVLYSLFACVLLLLIIGGTAAGQDPAQQDPQQEKPKEKSAVSPRGARSLVEDIFGNPRHKVGFSIGAFEVYQNNIYQTSQNLQPAMSATITARVFVNLGRRKSRFHLDYGAGYQFYNNKQGLNAPTQHGTAGYNYQLSRKATFDVQDSFSSSRNGYDNILSSILAPSYYAPNFSTEIMLQRQRITRNNLTARLGFNAGKNSFGLFGAYNLYRFGSASQQDLDGFSVGASYSRQITKWLFLSNSYSGYLNKVDPIYHSARIHQLQVGGFKFKFGANWQADIGGGIELANTNGRNLWKEDVSASLTWNSPSHMLSIQYHRGFFSTIGISGILQSDQGHLSFGSRLTNRLNLQMAALYVHGSNFYNNLGTNTNGSMEYYSALGGLQFSLFQGLIASANITYRNQRARGIAGLPISLDSYAAFAGLQYAFPSGIR